MNMIGLTVKMGREMTDYYEELKLDANMSVEDIKKELNHLENLWNKRAIVKPEEATRKLLMITEARKVFDTEASKELYDRQLAASRQPEQKKDPNAERRKEYEKWFAEATRYCNSGQYDLAKMAIEKATDFRNDESPDFYRLACSIYARTQDFGLAIDSINRAILIEPEEPLNYYHKGLTYDNECAAASYDKEVISEKCRSAFQTAVEKAKASGSKEVLGWSYGGLAWSYYYRPPKNSALAKRYAQEGIKVGDSFENSQNVLAAIEKEEREERIQQYRSRQAVKAREAKKRAEQQRQAELEQEQQKKLEERQHKKTTATTLHYSGWAVSILSILLIISVQSWDGALTITFVAFVGIALLNFGEAYHTGANTPVCTIVNAVVVILAAFKDATANYNYNGYSAASAAGAWQTFFIVIILFVATIIIGRIWGKRENRKVIF